MIHSSTVNVAACSGLARTATGAVGTYRLVVARCPNSRDDPIRWALTAAARGFAVVLGVVLGVPDQIFATVTQYAFLAAIAAVGTTATVGAAVLQRQRP